VNASPHKRVLVIACGALVREFRAFVKQLEASGNGPEVTLQFLPANLHNRPERIPGEVRAAIEECGSGFDAISLGYADCGTGGLLDGVCDDLGVNRLPGSHCYEFFAGTQVFADLHDREPGTFYLTDYLARHFEPLVIGGLGIDRYPQLLDTYFGNYKRLVFLSQTPSDELLAAARAAASRLGLEFEHNPTGLQPFFNDVSESLSIDSLISPNLPIAVTR
jgi:Protein of unknown function (DUF1638)